MTEHTFHRVGCSLTKEDVVFVCKALESNRLKLLCLRECKVIESDLKHILKYVGSCHSLHQLTLNIGMVTTYRHVELLAHCIRKNKSLTGLHIHGSELGDKGMQILGHAVSTHPGIVSLDVGDCHLSDMSIDILYSLMLPATDRPGLTELTLSDNPRISALGWAQFGMCLSNCNSLRWLFLDYNPLGDYGASCVLVALAASQSVEVVDMEGCGLTEHTGQMVSSSLMNVDCEKAIFLLHRLSSIFQNEAFSDASMPLCRAALQAVQSSVILHLVQNHLGSLSHMKLSNNRIHKSTIKAIKKHLSENHLDDIQSVSSVTFDELFSSNATRVSSNLKKKKRSGSSSRSSTSLSSLSDYSSSSNEKSSHVRNKTNKNEHQLIQGGGQSNIGVKEDQRQKMRDKNKAKKNIKYSKNDEHLQKKKGTEENRSEKNKQLVKNEKKKDNDDKNVENGEKKSAKEMNKLKYNNESKDIIKTTVEKSRENEDKMPERNRKNDKEGKQNYKDSKKKIVKDEEEKTYRDSKRGKNDKMKARSDVENSEGKKVLEDKGLKKNKSKQFFSGSDDEEPMSHDDDDNSDVGGSPDNDDDSTGEELEEVTVFYQAF